MLEVRVSTPREVRFSTKKCETDVHNGMSSRHKKPKNPHPHGFEVCSSDVPAMDLRDYLTRKRSVHQITPQCHCERLISVVLSDCHYSFQITKPSVFSRLSAASNSAKRRRSQKKKSFSDVKYTEATANMMGPSFTPSKFKRKQLAVSSEESDVDRSSGFEGYVCRTWRGVPTNSDPYGNNCPSRLQSVGQGNWGERWALCHRVRILVWRQQSLLTLRELPSGEAIQREGPSPKGTTRYDSSSVRIYWYP